MIARDCPDDLLAAARRGSISDLERQVRAAHLARCSDCRAAELAGALLGAPGFEIAPSARDRALVERVAARASTRSKVGTRRPGTLWHRAALVVTALLGLGGGASAWIGRRLAPPAETPATPLPIAPSHRRYAHRIASPLPPPLPRSAEAPAATASPPAPAKRRRGLAEHSGPTTPPPPETAAALFGQANASRREGDLRRAASLYEALRLHRPGSEQARLASISLGDLELRLGDPGAALRAFDAYLREVREGALRQEALFGRARCLRALGDGLAEADTWNGLLRDFPSSAYAPLARHRLDELRGAR